jgi:hypothetical protein
MRDGGTEAGKDAGQVNLEDSVPPGQVPVGEAVEIPDSGVVVEDGQSAERFHGGIDDLAYLVGLAHINGETDSAELVGDRLGGLTIDVEHGNLRALLRHATTGHDGPFPLK